MPNGIQIHHILPQDSVIIQQALTALNVDVANYSLNRIALPSTNELARAMSLPKHAGNHTWVE